MKIKVSDSLIEFAKLLSKKADLFIVGGYVRNYLLGIPGHDIDLASKLTIERLKKLTENTNFVVKEKSIELGTATIHHNNQVWEYSTFRRETYPPGGAHTPKKVVFISDFLADAKRRDFTINSILF